MLFYFTKFPLIQSYQDGKLQKMYLVKNKKSFYYFFGFIRNEKKYFIRLLYNHAPAYYVFFFSNLYMIKKNIKCKETSFLSYFKWATIEMQGTRCWFKTAMQLWGIGNRVVEEEPEWRQQMIITLGWANHLEVTLPPCSEFFYKVFTHKIRGRKMTTRNVFLFKMLNWNTFSNTLYTFRHLKYPDAYNANGVRYHREEFKLKPRKKWGVF